MADESTSPDFVQDSYAAELERHEFEAIEVVGKSFGIRAAAYIIDAIALILTRFC
jgi:hypothetical protein